MVSYSPKSTWFREFALNHHLIYIYFTLKTEDPMGSPSGTSATKGRLRNFGSLSLRSSRLTNTVVLADARS